MREQGQEDWDGGRERAPVTGKVEGCRDKAKQIDTKREAVIGITELFPFFFFFFSFFFSTLLLLRHSVFRLLMQASADGDDG